MSADIRNMSEVTTAKIFFPNLDGLRFLAFFLVYLQHAFHSLFTSTNFGFVFFVLKEGLFHSGDTGVSFFFSLSGFLITYLILNEVKILGKLDVLSFYIRRILRIWPLYYFVIIFGFLIYPKLKMALGFPGYIEAGNPLLHTFFLSNFDVMTLPRKFGAASLNITWTVSVEEQFYLIWPLLFFFIRPRFFKYIFPAIIIISALFRLSYINDMKIIKFHTLSVISDMAVGGWAAYFSLASKKFKSFFTNMKAFEILLIYAVFIFTLLFDEYLFIGHVLMMLRRVIFSAFFVFVILEQNFAENSLLKMSRVKAVSELGKYTYGLYLLHPIALTVCLNTARFLGVNPRNLAIGFLLGSLVFIVNILLSWASYNFYEKKFLRLKERFTHIRNAVVQK